VDLFNPKRFAISKGDNLKAAKRFASFATKAHFRVRLIHATKKHSQVVQAAKSDPEPVFGQQAMESHPPPSLAVPPIAKRCGFACGLCPVMPLTEPAKIRAVIRPAGGP